MSVKLVKEVILQLLSTREPEVICISGHWGVGKTFAWRNSLQHAQSVKGGIALDYYAYVSLFGIKSVDQLKEAIFENLVSTRVPGLKPDWKYFKENKRAVLSSKARTIFGNVKTAPLLAGYLGGSLTQALFASVKETIICLDDIERRGSELSIYDILGLASQLKDQKMCKIVIILNDEKLGEETASFRKHLEKVADLSLRFEPTPSEIMEIALPSPDDTYQLVRKHCTKLGISNIRIIKRMERSVNTASSLLADFHEGVLQQAIQTIVLITWCMYDPDSAPRLDYVEQFDVYLLGMLKEGQHSEQETEWNDLLKSYGFTSMDDLDRALLNGIRKGHFDLEALRKPAAKLDKLHKEGKANDSFRQAWEVFHGSFDENEDKVIDAIVNAFKTNIDIMKANELNASVWLLKGLGRAEQAMELISYYLSRKPNDAVYFDIEKMAFGEDVKDPDVRLALANKLEALRSEKKPVEILRSITSRFGWSDSDISTLAALTCDDFYDIFKSHRGDEMQKMIHASLSFSGLNDPSDRYNTIANRAREALRRVGSESRINALRISRYRVQEEEREK